MRGWNIFKVNRNHWEKSPPQSTPHARSFEVRNGARSDLQAECCWESEKHELCTTIVRIAPEHSALSAFLSRLASNEEAARQRLVELYPRGKSAALIVEALLHPSHVVISSIQKRQPTLLQYFHAHLLDQQLAPCCPLGGWSSHWLYASPLPWSSS